MSDKYESFERKPSNREQATAPKYGKSWCDKCDQYFGLAHQGRCPVCGNKPTGPRKRLKKDTNAR